MRRCGFETGVEMFSFSSSSLTELTLCALRDSRLDMPGFSLEGTCDIDPRRAATAFAVGVTEVERVKVEDPVEGILVGVADDVVDWASDEARLKGGGPIEPSTRF